MNSEWATASKKTILIVDDIPDNLRVLSATLSEQGYKVRCAKNGTMALKGAQVAAPDLILLDVKMPDISGYEVCQYLKAEARTREIPVIFMSALEDVLDKVKAFEVGGVDYITKPFQVEEVLARIKNHLALQAAKAEIQQLNTKLEQRVEQRTTQLAATNYKLQQEILERQQAVQLLNESEARLEAIILNSLEEVVWSVAAQNPELIYINPAAQKVYGIPTTEFFKNQKLWLEAVHPEDRERVEKGAQILRSRGSYSSEYRILRADGEVRWLYDRAHLICDSTGMPLRIDGIISDITERKRIEQQLIHDALHDHLTGLPNRTFFLERLELAFRYAKRHPDYLFAVLFIDLDRFKIVNDSLGHAVGDRLLIAFTSLIQQCLRTSDTVARFGRDEFTVLLEDIRHIADAIKIADRIQAELVQPFEREGHTVFTSASIGIKLFTSISD